MLNLDFELMSSVKEEKKMSKLFGSFRFIKVQRLVTFCGDKNIDKLEPWGEF